ncbi:MULTISPECIES: ferredoxin [unclassified Streptosporangium]|uniref:ferredoxin n=1 Tax=unclassified Streptosporangium TaxID=2632669 RepID=UPI002DD9D7A3|nr:MULTISPECIES: ferredoxin [unclassified Streptosporangium]
MAIDPGPLETDSEWSGIEVTVEAGVCVGAGQCVLAAPEVFDQGTDGLVVLLDETPPPSLHAAVREAARRCPSGAVTVGDSTAR